jgi:ABC-type uncharacterized transport system ATPase subunit
MGKNGLCLELGAGKDQSKLAVCHAGMAHIPEERMRNGGIREFQVQKNVFLHGHGSPGGLTPRPLSRYANDLEGEST